MDLRLKVPFTLIINGSSSCGKTTVIEKLLTHAEDCFTEQPVEVVWIYADHTADQKLFDRLRERLPITFRAGFPADSIQNNTLFTKAGPKLLILDDIVTELRNNQALFDLFNVLSHHQNISIIVSID